MSDLCIQKRGLKPKLDLLALWILLWNWLNSLTLGCYAFDLNNYDCA